MRQRHWLHCCLTSALALFACAPSDSTDGSGTGSTDSGETTSDGGPETTGDETGDTGDTGSEDTGEECVPGTEGCKCTPVGTCEEGLECYSNLCVDPDCPEGTEGCKCGPGEACDDDLLCLSGLCVDGSGLCPWANDGYCDEPPCLPGTDGDDCCATLQDGVCEEESQGGECPDGSDFYDCGYCPEYWVGDGECDEAQGTGLCPEGSDEVDCCATVQDGVCEEESQGGECPDGSDWYDCGYCPEQWQGDLFCVEPDGIVDLCPPGTDPLDCCGYHDGDCGEESMGGDCPDGSDFYDCGYCPEEWQGDGWCDEPQGEDLCPAGTDPLDC